MRAARFRLSASPFANCSLSRVSISSSRTFASAASEREAPTFTRRLLGNWVTLGIGTTTLLGGAAYVVGSRDVLHAEPQKAAHCASQTHCLPVENAILTAAPNVPPPITRRTPAILNVHFTVKIRTKPVDPFSRYEFWTYNESVPGPFIRARVGDVLNMRLTNEDPSGMSHNVDFHAVLGPGGGAAVLTADQDETKAAQFKLTTPGLFIYHCSVGPMALHISSGMFGLILVEPEEGLPPVDKEFYVVQSEVYARNSGNGDLKEADMDALDSVTPSHVFFNGRVDSMTGKDERAPDCAPLQVRTGDRVRIFFGNAGPNLYSAFHIIGGVMDKVYREGDLISAPARGLQTTTVPPGGAAVVEFIPVVPGNYTMLDHSVANADKGAIGFINAVGDPRPDIYASKEPPKPCPSCKTHPTAS